ncbi:MAG: DsrE/DsrF/DrsH-like family protein [Candidatus Fermentibacteraceae bacterium]|nr:DsrE/DsrF/DrsH-like family protein [Candidatus Fermentibacteraceae bacterium]MBN2608633.1 DsrE/DsrF/DrsH-like family protein [Candidatus Fermentibacteraceae bacterium]
MMGKVAIVCNGSENSNVYPTFIIGSAAAASGDDVIIFFTPGAVPALKPGHLEGINGKGMPPMKELVNGVKALGGRMILCELALEAKDVTPGDLRDDLEIGGATSFMADIRDANVTFSF